ncbi:MAG: surface lipoprotein assembly modifier [Pseudomonadales bacterium]
MKYVSLISTVSLLLLLGQCSLAAENVVAKESAGVISAEQRSLQKLFVMGLLTLEQRDYKASIAIFSEMLKQTNSPRVRLELARALFLDRQFSASKTHFQKVLFKEGVPWGVKQNIRQYLNQIDNDIGFIKFGLSFVSDSNPGNFTSSEEVSISGRSFKVVRPEGDQEAKGIRYNMNSGLPLSSDSRTQAFLNVSFSDFQGGELDRWLGDVGIISSFEALPKVKAKVGVEYSEKNGKKQYDFSYLSIFYTPSVVDQFSFRHEMKIAKLVVDGASHLDADVYRVATIFTSPLKNGMFLDGGIAIDKSVAREAPYSYNEGVLSLGLDLPVNDWAFKLSSSLGLRLYGDVDPFFGERRRDTNKKFGFLLSNKKIHSYGYKPEVGVTYEQNDSSLAFFEYDKISLVFTLKESY